MLRLFEGFARVSSVLAFVFPGIFYLEIAGESLGGDDPTVRTVLDTFSDDYTTIRPSSS